MHRLTLFPPSLSCLIYIASSLHVTNIRYLLPYPTYRYPGNHPHTVYATRQEVIQEKYHQQLFAVLIPTLEDPEPRCVHSFPQILVDANHCATTLPPTNGSHRICSVHSHAAAALINFCEGVERDTLLPYLDPIVERLLKLLNPGAPTPTATTPTPTQTQMPIPTSAATPSEGQSPPVVRRYVQEQAITTLAMVADASEATFAKVCFGFFFLFRFLYNASLTARLDHTYMCCMCSIILRSCLFCLMFCGMPKDLIIASCE